MANRGFISKKKVAKYITQKDIVYSTVKRVLHLIFCVTD